MLMPSIPPQLTVRCWKFHILSLQGGNLVVCLLVYLVNVRWAQQNVLGLDVRVYDAAFLVQVIQPLENLCAMKRVH